MNSSKTVMSAKEKFVQFVIEAIVLCLIGGFLGIVVGALLYANFQPIMAFDTIINDGFIKGIADPWNIGIFMQIAIIENIIIKLKCSQVI